MNYLLRVAMIIHGYFPRIGGAERQLAAVAPLLQAKGVDVQILTRQLPGAAPFEVIDGIPVHRLPVPGPKAVASISFTLAALPLLRRLQPDLIHAHEFISPATTAMAAKKLYQMPVVVTAHRSGVLGDVRLLQQRRLGAWRMSLLRRSVDTFIAISQEIGEELSQAGIPAVRQCVIPNGVDTEHFKPLSSTEKAALRVHLGLPDNAPLAVFAGRLAEEKRLDHLLTVWPAVQRDFPDAQLLLIGSGPQEAALKHMAGEGVCFVGALTDVAPYLQAADIFVLPSIAEGLSVALLEAMACGLAVIATRVGAAPEMIHHAVDGWLIQPEDIPALQIALHQLLGDADCRASMGQRARTQVVEKYALPKVTQLLYEEYCRILDAQKGGL